MKYLIFIGAFVVGLVCIRYFKWLAEKTGLHFDAVDSFFGPGGMYTFWKILGVLLILFSFYVLFGPFF